MGQSMAHIPAAGEFPTKIVLMCLIKHCNMIRLFFDGDGILVLQGFHAAQGIKSCLKRGLTH
jgi:hypothetical protein